LASSIPISQLIFTKCDFFLDTIFLGFYTFVNCKVSLAGSMSTRQRENRNNGNQESSSKEASEEGSQENCKEEVSRQRNRQHNRGTPKASPDVFLVNALSPVFMRLRSRLCSAGKFPGCGESRVAPGSISRSHERAASFPYSILPGFAPPGVPALSPRTDGEKMRRERDGSGLRVPVAPGARGNRAHRLPKWYWAITLSDETVER
jgi:hypothetical protein